MASATTITVETTADAVAADGDCSLREAVASANTNGVVIADCELGTGNDTILLPEGVFALSGAAGDDSNGSGDLDVANTSNAPSNDLTFLGAGDSKTFIDAASLDRAIDVQSDGATSSVDVVIEALAIRNGSVAGDGGAIRMRDANGSVTLDTTTVSGSSATGNGGALAFASAAGSAAHPVAVTDTEVVGNSASDGGGVWASTNSDIPERSVLVTGSTFEGNSAAGTGGAIRVLGSGGETRLDMQNDSLRSNSAPGGGAGIAFGGAGQLDVRFSTLSGNHVYAAFPKGAAIQTTSDGAVVRLLGNIIYFNAVFPPPDFQGAESSCAEVGGNGVFTPVLVDYNLSHDGSCNLYGTGNLVGAIAGMSGLFDYGGPTRTMGLYDSSPALNQVPPASCIAIGGGPLATDQRGEERPAPEPGSNCDIGAFEGSIGSGGGGVVQGLIPGEPGVLPCIEPERTKAKKKRRKKGAKKASTLPAPIPVECAGAVQKPKKKAKRKKKRK